MCHLVLLMPVFALVFFWIWPLAVAGPAYAAVSALSLWMYVWIWRAMQRPVLGGAEELLHSKGEVVEVAEDMLHVRVHSEIWNAVSAAPLESFHRGDRVKVVGMSGLILRVTRSDDADEQV